jgi:hypothetical protein
VPTHSCYACLFTKKNEDSSRSKLEKNRGSLSQEQELEPSSPYKYFTPRTRFSVTVCNMPKSHCCKSSNSNLRYFFDMLSIWCQNAPFLFPTHPTHVIVCLHVLTCAFALALCCLSSCAGTAWASSPYGRTDS